MGALDDLAESDRRFLKRAVPVAAFIGGLCCFTPVVVVLLGIGSVSYAVSLTDLLYYQYRWAFQFAALTFLLGALAVHLYTDEEVCSLDEAVRRRRKILNLVGLSLFLGAVAYVLWLYVVVELLGLALGIW
jgi:hypothetical protein